MSGAEIIGLISAIIAIVDASIKVCNAASDPSSLSSGFRDVATRLPLIQETLMTTLDGLTSDSEPSKSSLALKGVLEGCKHKSMQLEDLLRADILPAGTGTWKRVGKALTTVPKENKVQHLMDGIIADLQVLTFNHAVKAATRKDVEALIEAAAEGRGARSESSGRPLMTFHNSGSGLQIAHTQSGNLNFNTGTGAQVNFDGPTAGTFYFGAAPETTQKLVKR
ncbi:hypothetical protein NM208_g1949 [Fusarium decemcellulare]|uniref:Uncharacterized protein n=2 Tax=Fusarium decemcellulare TaxID=57161 RepID=A0ACC1SU27_9HYPO|nr:hypothetical protein NM208_g3982 [Fusarium decemcellulare]KAJ3546529.1 hypothetical protein NM208_g1949 [Fusarium decemcellulare]